MGLMIYNLYCTYLHLQLLNMSGYMKVYEEHVFQINFLNEFKDLKRVNMLSILGS